MIKGKLSVLVSVGLLSSGTAFASWNGGFSDDDFNNFFGNGSFSDFDKRWQEAQKAHKEFHDRYFGAKPQPKADPKPSYKPYKPYEEKPKPTFNTHTPEFKSWRNAQLRSDLLGLFKESYHKDFLENLILREKDDKQVLFAEKVLHILKNTDSDNRYEMLSVIHADYRFKADDAAALAGKLCGHKKGSDRVRVAQGYIEKDLPARLNAEENAKAEARYFTSLNNSELAKKLFALFDDSDQRFYLEQLINREYNAERKLVFASKVHHILTNTPADQRKEMLTVIRDWQFKTEDAEILAGKLCGHKTGNDRLSVARDYVNYGIAERKKAEEQKRRQAEAERAEAERVRQAELKRQQEERRKAEAARQRAEELRREEERQRQEEVRRKAAAEKARKEEIRRKEEAERKRAEDLERMRQAEAKRQAEERAQRMTADEILGRAANAHENQAFSDYKTLFKNVPSKQDLLSFALLKEFDEFNGMNVKSKIDAFNASKNSASAQDAAAKMLLQHFIGYSDVQQDIEQLAQSLDGFKAKAGDDRFNHVVEIAKKSGLIRGKVSEGSKDNGYYVTIDRMASDKSFGNNKPTVGEEIYIHPNGYNRDDATFANPQYIYFNNASKKKFRVGNRVYENIFGGTTTKEYKQARDVRRAH